MRKYLVLCKNFKEISLKALWHLLHAHCWGSIEAFRGALSERCLFSKGLLLQPHVFCKVYRRLRVSGRSAEDWTHYSEWQSCLLSEELINGLSDAVSVGKHSI